MNNKSNKFSVKARERAVRQGAGTPDYTDRAFPNAFPAGDVTSCLRFMCADTPV